MGLTSLTVFVVADDEHGTHLRDTFLRWSGEGLVEESAWVTPASTRIPDFGPPVVQAEIVADGTSRTEDLFRFIGKYRLNVVRVVLGQLAASDDEPVDAILRQAALSIADTVHRVLPRSAREDGHSTQLWRINVVAPVSGVHSADPGMLIQDWNVNAVVAAEDRPDADHANVFVRDPGNAVGHTAAALAAAGGVFSGVEAGVFDELAETQSTSNGREILVMRVAARAIVGDDPETRLAVQTLAAVNAEPTGAAAFVDWGRSATNPDRVVADVTDHLLGRDPWRSGEPMRAPGFAQRHQSFKTALRDAVRFDLKMFTVVPGWAARRGKATLEDIATDAIVGQGADTLVRFNPATPEAMRTSADASLQDVDERARRTEIQRASESVATPDPGVWAHLRSVAFATVDGGDLPDDVQVPRLAGVREVLPPARVVPDPLDCFTGRGRTVQPSDAAGARALGAEIHQDLERATKELASLQSAAAVEELSEPKGFQSDDAQAQAQRAVGGFAEATGEDSSERQDSAATPSPAKRARLTTASAQAALEALQAEQEAFRDWAQRIGGSVLFKVTDEVNARRDDYRARHDRLSADLIVTTPKNDDLVRAQRHLVRWWVASVAVWLLTLLAVGATYLFVQDRLREDSPALETLPSTWVWIHENWYWAVLGLTVITLAVLGAENHRYYLANRRYLGVVQLAADARMRASEDVLHTWREAARLDHLSIALRDWTTIIGWVLHHPHSAVADLTRDIDESVVATLPAAFAIARNSDEDEIPKQAIVQAARRLHPQGWAAGAFDHAYEVHQTESLAEDPAGLIAADLDQSDGAHGPRRELLRFWAGRTASQVLTAEAVDALRQAVLDSQIVLPTRQVKRLGEYSTGAIVAEPTFYRGVATADTTFVREVFTHSALVEGKQVVSRSDVWLPAIAGDGGGDDSDAIRSGSRLQAGTHGVALRADISRLLTTDDLEMFSTGRMVSGPVTAGRSLRAPVDRGDVDVWA